MNEHGDWFDEEVRAREEALLRQEDGDQVAIRGVLESNGGQRMMQRLREECDWLGLASRAEKPPLCPLAQAKREGKRELVAFLMQMAAGAQDAEE